MSALLAEVVRSGYVESTHNGSLVVLRGDGSVALAVGDVDNPIFPRSSNKPLQAVGLLDAGWDPTPEQLALAAASHNGEPGHVDVVRTVLGELGPEALRNPARPPLHDESWFAILRAGGAETALTQNCSGKHAGMLATCVLNGWPTEDYLSVEHPVQRACLHAIERLSGELVRQIAVDGCGAPQHALTLPGLARAYSALVTGDGTSRRTAEAMRTHPWHVGGTGRDVTRLMEAIPGLVVKDGAEGVCAAGLADGGALALKIQDGSGRARTPVLVAALRVLGVDVPLLDELAEGPITGGGMRVGEVRVAGQLVTG